jgi:hypothetical protein
MDALTPRDPRRANVSRVIAEIDLELRRAPSPAIDPPAAPPPVAEPRPVEPAAVVAMVPASSAPARGRRGARLAGITTLALGGAVAVTGAALFATAASENSLIAKPPADWRYDPGLAQRRDTFATTGIVLLTVGGAALAAGAGTLIYWSRARKPIIAADVQSVIGGYSITASPAGMLAKARIIAP